MNPKRLIAALLVAVTLAAPGTVLAAGDVPVTKPMPAVDVKEGQAALLAQVKVTREEAIASVTRLFAIPAQMGDPNVSLSQSREYASWQLNWRTPSNQPNPRSISVTVNAVTGAISNYYSSAQPDGDIPLSYNRGEAYKVAADWLAKLAPEKTEALRYQDNPLQYGFWGGNASFQFHWDRMEQGYPVRGDGIDITIDARTGELQAYYITWRQTFTAELPKTVLTREQADAAYHNQLPMQMLYRYYQKQGTEKGDWKLVYRPAGGAFPSVTQDGKLVDDWGKEIDFARLTDYKLVPAAAKPYAKPAKPITPEAALAVAKGIAGRSDAPGSMDCREEGEKTKRQTCSFTWSDPEQGMSNINLQIDLETGLVINFGNWAPVKPVTDPAKYQPKYTQAQAVAFAIEFLQKYRPDLAGTALIAPNFQYDEKMRLAGEPQRFYNFQFALTREFISVYGWEASVQVDAETGEVRYFYGWLDRPNAAEPFPELTGLIKQEAAIDSFLKNQGLELTWVTYNSPEMYPGKPRAEADAKPVTTLVWAPRRVIGMDMIDARSGVPYDYSGRDLIEAAKRPIDIDGHPMQREIELLWAKGIFELKDGKFNPEQTVSAAELARWLVLARGMQPYPMYDFAMNFMGKGEAGGNLAASTEAPYLGAALRAGILLPEDFTVDADPNATVSRELAALWVVRALGYGDIAKMENRIDTTFADKAEIGAKFANAAALIQGLKISRADANGKFNPQRSITRAEAAQMLFAVASKPRFY